jgi:hypothetical protein
LRFCIVILGIGLLTVSQPAAEAQLSAYGTVAWSSYGFNYQGGSYHFDNETASIGAGAFYNFPIHSRLTAGIDGRVLYGPASYGGVSVDGALRIGFVPTKVRLRPYFEIGGGVVTAVANPGFDPTRITNGALLILGGLDIRITDKIDFRAIDYGGAVGTSSSGPASGVAFFDSGFVYHFRPSQQEQKLNP